MADSVVTQCLCIFDVVAVVGYASMTAMVYLSFVVPTLKDLAAHGKTRPTDNGASSFVPSASTSTTSTWLRRFHIVHGDFWMVKKKRFRQFYVMGLSCLTATAWVSTKLQRPSSNTTTFILVPSTILLYLHLFRRLYECTFVHKWKDSSVMHIAGYLVGAIHYVWLPMVFIRLPCEDCLHNLLGPRTLSQVFYNQYSNMEQAPDPTDDATTPLLLMWRLSPILLCLWGQYQQHVHHVILANMRKPQGTAAVKDKPSLSYSLPTTGWFRYVTCPHYLAEILVYVAFAFVLHQEHVPGHRHWVVLFWVASNLTLSALINYKWYKENLPPTLMQGKKAIFPFIL
jgi:3-oxo-5-alpha-steroid 4-dehydrogenase 3 / polyprenol reductase